jgi:hypothetical protein
VAFVWQFAEIPDNVMAQPRIGRELVCFFSTLNGDWGGRAAAAG